MLQGLNTQETVEGGQARGSFPASVCALGLMTSCPCLSAHVPLWPLLCRPAPAQAWPPPSCNCSLSVALFSTSCWLWPYFCLTIQFNFVLYLNDSFPGEESDWPSFGQISQQTWCEGRSSIQTWPPGPTYPLSTSLVEVAAYFKDRQNLVKGIFVSFFWPIPITETCK